jgi:hypothetical protein
MAYSVIRFKRSISAYPSNQAPYFKKPQPFEAGIIANDYQKQDHFGPVLV